ncbi:MAG: hypothetical protein JO184_04975 [Gammaproteobacteria bacterium]|nr:hypothetical protein [Gammaproteobacteria bacterium]MBV8308387.1 hypothetical protein [Gammaproteobacteria bacterium]
MLLTAASHGSFAYNVTLTPASPKMIYFQVGNGLFTGGNYTPIKGNGQPTGAPGTNTTINKVTVSVPAGVVGNGTAQAMTTDSAAANSYWDGYLFCNLPAQLYIGGFYRTTAAGTNTATVTATLAASLTDAAGDTLPFSQISWTTGGNGDAGAEPFPAGSFNATTLTVGSIGQNHWDESCWTFSYANTVVPAAGTYTGRVTYTLSAP